MRLPSEKTRRMGSVANIARKIVESMALAGIAGPLHVWEAAMIVSIISAGAVEAQPAERPRFFPVPDRRSGEARLDSQR